MKNLISVFLCLFVSCLSLHAQDEVCRAIKSESIDLLQERLDLENIDNCIELKGKLYGYLAVAIKLESVVTLDYLIEAGADVNLVCKDKSPLMYAVKYGQLECVQSLIKAGADLDAKNGDKTAIDYAKKYNQKEILSFLLRL